MAAKSAGRFAREVIRAVRRASTSSWMGEVMSVMALGSSGDVERPEREDSPPPSRAVCRLLRRSATSPGRGPVVPTLVGSW